MSETIDSRVVEMRFDNKQFESNVQTSMSTLEKLKQSLNLTGASKGLENVNAAASKFNLNGMGSAIETVHAKFSALEVMGVTALANITNSAVNAGKRIVSALTIDPIKTGFNEYETKINSIQTIMSNTASKGTTMADVTKVIDDLNTYADKTIYNFSEMTRNIGTFTAAGVGLEESAAAIKGIANLAAASGSSSQQASTAMYQLSQALATGTVKLMDWNSVVNAGMGGEKFQEALKATAREHGVAVDKIIEKNGSFRDSLQEGWLSADILNETLNKFTVDGAKQYAKSMMESGKWTQEQADALIKEAQSMEDAATKVKTFTQLWDTLKESAQSGWSQSWEIIIGNFEEAKELLTEVSDTIGGLIGKSADARNNMLQGWKDLGGRTALIDALRNSFEGIMSIIKPVNEAFREIFPPVTSEQLYNLTVGLKNLTEHLKISDETAVKIKSTFKGVFSVLDIGVEALKAFGKGAIELLQNFTGFSGGVLDATSSICDFLSNLRDSIVETNFFGTAVDKVVEILKNGITKIKDFTKSLQKSFDSPDFSGFVSIFKGIWNVVTQVSSAIIKAVGSVGSTISEVFGKGDIFEVINSGLFAGILLSVKKFTNGLTNGLDDVGDFLGNITGILDEVRGCFEAYQQQLKAETLLKIASAIAILSASLFLLSTIDPDALGNALVGITGLFVELMGSLAVFNKISSNTKGTAKSCAAMISMSVAVLILASALKKISSLDWGEIAKGLVSVGALMGEISIFLRTAKFGGKVTSTAVGIAILSSAMLILAKAVKNFGSMEWNEIGKGLTSIGVLLTELSIFTKLTGNAKHVISTGVALVLIAASMKIFASAISDFGSMEWTEIGKGLVAMAGALAEVTIAMNLMPKNVISIGAGLVIVGAALEILTNVLGKLGNFSWTEIGKGLAAIGGSLLELSIALNLMKGTLSGSAALIIAAAALAVIAPVIKTLGGMSWTEIGKGLLTLAGAFAVVGIAGALLSPLIPTILGLAAAFTLLGVASLAIGAGLTLIGIGFNSIAIAVATGATAIVAGLTVIITGLLNLIPTIAQSLGKGIVSFAQVIGNYAPQLAESFLQLLSEVMKPLATHIPEIVDSLLTLFIGVINSLANHMPTLIQACMNLVGELFKGIINALNGLDTENLLKGVIAVGLMTALMYALSGVVALIPSAMAGLLGLGLVVAELAIIIAAIGGLAQIPGLKWLIGEGGNLLQAVGTAIGQFVGGIAGGFMSGVSSQFPKIGSDLSSFMSNVQPFIEGAKSIDASALDGVKALGEAILILTAADILSGIASFITGGNSISDFASELVPLGEGMKDYAKTVEGIDSDSIAVSAKAATELAKVGSSIENSGGLIGLIVGENDMSAFGEQLVPFGEGLKSYSEAVTGIKSEDISESAKAATELAKVGSVIENSGGLLGLIVGNNDLSTFGEQLVPFGEGLKSYSEAVAGLDVESITTSVKGAKTLIELGNSIQNNSGGLVSLFTGDNSLSNLGKQLIPFGIGMKLYSQTVSGLETEPINNSVTAARSLVALANNIQDNSGGLISLFTGDNSLSNLGEQLVPFGEGLKSYSESVNGINPEAVTNSATAAKSLCNLANSIQNNSGGLVSLFTGDNDLSGFGKQLKPFGEGLSEYSNAVKGVDSESVENSVKAAKQLVSAVNSTANINTSGVESFKNAVNTLGQIDTKSFVKAFGDASYEFVVAGSNMISSIAKGIQSKESLITTTISKLVTSALKTITSKSQLFTIEGSNVITKFSTGITTKRGIVTNSMTAILNSTVTTIRNNYTNFSNAGGYLGDGLVVGINSRQTAVYNAAYKLGQKAVQGEKDGQKSNSPSKLTIQSGKWFGEGLVIGIKAMGNKVYNAGYNLGDTAVSSISSSISKVADLINTGIDVEPTIRPVLDLSDVQSGARTISGLFANGASVGVSANLNAISSMMNERNQNGGSDDIVSAINKLRKDIGNIGGTSYTINGITYDDGSGISNAVETLVRAARMERRV